MLMPTKFTPLSIVLVFKKIYNVARGLISRDIAVVYNVYVSKAVLTSNNSKYHSKISSVRLYVYLYISNMFYIYTIMVSTLYREPALSGCNYWSCRKLE